MEYNIKEIRELIVNLNSNLDISVLEKLEAAINNNIITKEKYNHILDKIYINLQKGYSLGKIMAVRVLLNQLAKLVHNDLKPHINTEIDYNKLKMLIDQTSKPVQGLTDNSDVLNLLNSISKKLENMQVTSNNTESINNTVSNSKDSIFIDSLNLEELSKIKSNINIDSKVGNNLNNSIEKLKKLKEGK